MNLIEFKDTSMWYGEVIALNEVNFEIKPGITGLVGSNGAGKTTALRLCASLLRPTIGEVLINDEPIWQNYKYLKNMGYSPEIDRQFSFLTGREFLQWSAKMHDMSYEHSKKRVAEVIELISMKHAADRPIDGYSRGMRQRVKVGQALLHEPEVLLLDEPLSGTDPIGRKILVELFKDMVADKNITMIVSSHVLHELERISDKILLLNSGKLVAEGKVRDVRKALSKIPQKVRIRSSDPVRVSQKIMPYVKAVNVVDEENLIVEVSDREELLEHMNKLFSNNSVLIFEITSLDEDLSSVFNLITNYNKNNS